MMASPELREKAKQTNLAKYGVEWASSSDAVKAKIQQTCLDKYGVVSTALVPEIRQKQLAAMEAKYGAAYFASEQGKREIREVLKERYGVEHVGSIEGHWDKAKATFQERYGVDHPLQLEVFREKQYQTNIERYGTPFTGGRNKGMNGFEQTVYDMCPDGLEFVGDGQYWRKLPLLDGYKNPDFLASPRDNLTKVVECFGNYWHGPLKTGISNAEHEALVIAAYADIGIRCLVLWESEVKADPKDTAQRLFEFIYQ